MKLSYSINRKYFNKDHFNSISRRIKLMCSVLDSVDKFSSSIDSKIYT